jgi:hypothetical protein
MQVALLGAVMVLIAVGVWACERRRDRLFKERFPPMTDEEFVRECGPGTNPQIALRVRRIVADQLGVDYERVHPSSSFANDLMAD